MHSVAMLVYPNFQPLGLSVGAVFEYANFVRGAPTYDFKVVSELGGPVMCSQGYSVNTIPISGMYFDTLIVTGDNLAKLPEASLLEYVKRSAAQSRRIASVCTGSFVLAEAGLLDGKSATTHWFHTRAFEKQYPKVKLDIDRIYVNEGSVWTSAGMSAGMDLALALVENDFGSDFAKEVARKMVVHQRRAGGQSQFSVLLDMDAKSDYVRLALNYAKENMQKDLSVEKLAAATNLSPRQFSRVFRQETGQSPAKAVEHLRVESARLMMETTKLSVEEIAKETGFGDRERMRQAFLRAFGQSPQAIRRTLSVDE